MSGSLYTPTSETRQKMTTLTASLLTPSAKYKISAAINTKTFLYCQDETASVRPTTRLGMGDMAITREIGAALNILPEPSPGTSIHCGSPLKMIVREDALRWLQMPDLAGKQHIANVLQTLPVFLITANPFYPRCLRKNNNYQPAFIHRERLMKELQRCVQHTPFFDIFPAQNGTMEAWIQQHLFQQGSQ
ncbi:MAG: hypothetical protein RBT34_02820 [Anaerolineaceae bacterium]|jgi:hypothetical protein|nr:hypothetical protein [Anaerolineaceae bacterium]